MELTFLDTRLAPERPDGVAPTDEDVAAWAAAHEAAVEFVCELASPAVLGVDVRRTLAGVFTRPAERVLGLRAWDDADEGILGESPYALFDIEKIIRMALHQSGLAFETLVSPVTLFEVPAGFPRREIAARAVTRDLVAHYADVTRQARARWSQGRVEPGDDARLREVLTGWALGSHAAVSLHLDTLLSFAAQTIGEVPTDLSEPETFRWFAASDAFTLEPEASVLPVTPTGYDALDALLVARRMGS